MATLEMRIMVKEKPNVRKQEISFAARNVSNYNYFLLSDIANWKLKSKKVTDIVVLIHQ